MESSLWGKGVLPGLGACVPDPLACAFGRISEVHRAKDHFLGHSFVVLESLAGDTWLSGVFRFGNWSVNSAG